MGGVRDERAVPTAIRARRARGPARHVPLAAILAAFTGLATGLLVGWSLARRETIPPAPVASLAVPAPARLVAPPPKLAAPPRPPEGPRTAAPAPAPHLHRRHRALESAVATVPWWSTVVGDNPYR